MSELKSSINELNNSNSGPPTRFGTRLASMGGSLTVVSWDQLVDCLLSGRPVRKVGRPSAEGNSMEFIPVLTLVVNIVMLIAMLVGK